MSAALTVALGLTDTSDNTVLTFTELIANIGVKLRNTPQRWATTEIQQAVLEALHAAAPLGPTVTASGAGATDGVWTVNYMVHKVRSLTITGTGVQMDVPVAALRVRQTSMQDTEIRLPYGCASSYTVSAELIVKPKYDVDVGADVLAFPWPELIEYYTLAALYEQRIDLVTMSDEDGYTTGMTMWRGRADARKAELMAMVYNLTPEAPRSSTRKR